MPRNSVWLLLKITYHDEKPSSENHRLVDLVQEVLHAVEDLAEVHAVETEAVSAEVHAVESETSKRCT